MSGGDAGVRRGVVDDVTAQLAEQLGDVTAGLAALTVDIGWQSDIIAQAPLLAAQLCQDDDDHLAAQTAIDVMCALWPTGDPPPDWWSTPLGRMVARSGGVDGSDAVTQSVAAAMLGVTRGTVAQLVHRGTLDRHPDGGVTRASVLARLAR